MVFRMEIWRAFALIGLFVGLISLFLPWFVSRFSFKGKYEFNYLESVQHLSDIGQDMGQYSGAALIVFAIIICGFSIILEIIGMIARKICVIAGGLGIFGGILFYTGVNVYKSEVASASFYGPFIASIIDTGIGPIMMIISGIIVLISFIISEQALKDETCKKPSLAPLTQRQ